jgi:polyisoprenoid-binding protein YceI
MRLAGIAVLAGLVALASLHRPVAASAAAEGEYLIDPVHSTVHFRVLHFGASNFQGRFNDVSGTFSLDGGKVSVTVKAGSVDTHNEQRDGHLRSPDFLSAKEFPEITFVADEVKEVDGGVYEAAGTFTLRGVSKPLTVRMNHVGTGKGMKGETLVGLEGSFTIRRTEYGVSWRPDVLGDEVTILVSLEGVKR